MAELKKNTEFVWVFKMVDETDFAAAETGKTVTVNVSEDGAAFAALTGSPSVTEIANGWYKVTVAAADMNADVVVLRATATGCAPTEEKIYPPVANSGDVTTWLGTACATPTVAGVPEVDVTHIEGADGVLAAIEGECQDALQGEKLDQLMNQPVSGGWAGVTADSALSLMAGGTFNASTDSLENIRDALTTIDDFLDTEVAAILAAVDTEVAAIKAKTDNLPAAPAATGDIPTAAANADAVWDELATGHTDAGKAGEMLWTKIAAIVAKLPTNYIMGSSDQDNHDTDIDAILVDTAALADTNLTEPSSGAPSASITVRQALAYLYFAFRNKRTQTSSTQTFFNDAGSSIFKRTHSDDGTTHTAEELAAP